MNITSRTKTLCSLVLYTYVISWIATSILYPFVVAYFPINLSYGTILNTASLQDIMSIAQKSWPYYLLIGITSIITDVALCFLGIVINRVFQSEDKFLKNFILISFLVSGFTSLIADILSIVSYQMLGTMGTHLATTDLPALAISFIAISNINILFTVTLSLLFGGIGFIFTYLLVKPLTEVSRFWANLTLTLAIIAFILFLLGFAAVITQSALLINITLGIMFFIVPILNVIWLIGLIRYIKKQPI